MACQQRHKHSYVSYPRANEGPRHGPGHDGGLKARSTTTHFPFQISTMASITLSDNVLNATETATVTFTFDADYALLPEKITVTGARLPPPPPPPAGQPGFGQPTFPPATAATERTDCTITVNNNAGGVLAQSAAFTVDNVRPYIVDFEMPSVIQGSGAQTTITITYSEPVSAASVTIFTSAEGGYSGGTPSDGGRKWTYQYWPKAANGTNYIGIYLSTFKDLAGNAGSASTDAYYVKSMTVDSLKPTVASASIAKSDLRLGEKTTITITFSELVTRSSFTIEDLQVDAGKGTLSNLRVAPSDTTATTTAATTWLVDLEAPATRPATGLHRNQIRSNRDGITDVAGNAGAGRGVSLPARYNIDDGLPPTVTIAPAATILRAGETMTVTFTFSEKVTGFGTEDIQYDTSKGTLGALTAVGTDGKVWTATYTPQPGTESADNTIRVNLAGVLDAQGNAGTGTGSSGNFSIDTRPPGVTVTISDERLTAGESATITITFSERVTGFAKNAIDLSQANGTLGDLTPVGTDGKAWTATFTPTARLARTTNNRLTLNLYNVRDAAGNAPAASSYAFNQYTVDTMVFVLSNATVNRDQLVLSYSDETMLDGSADRAPTNESFTVVDDGTRIHVNPPTLDAAPPNESFTVLVDGTRIDVNRVTVDAAARTVTLTLASAVTTGQTVTVAYQDTDTSDNKALQEAGTGDDAASFAARTVTNLTQPPVAPAPPEAPGAGAPDDDRGRGAGRGGRWGGGAVPPPPPAPAPPRHTGGAGCGCAGRRPRRCAEQPGGPGPRPAAPRWLGRPGWRRQRRRHQRQPAGRRRFDPRPDPGGRQPERQAAPGQQRAHYRTGAQRCPGQSAQGHGDADRADLIQGVAGRRPQHRELQPVRRPGARRQRLLAQEQRRHLGEPGQRTLRRQGGQRRRAHEAGLSDPGRRPVRRRRPGERQHQRARRRGEDAAVHRRAVGPGRFAWLLVLGFARLCATFRAKPDQVAAWCGGAAHRAGHQAGRADGPVRRAPRWHRTVGPPAHCAERARPAGARAPRGRSARKPSSRTGCAMRHPGQFPDDLRAQPAQRRTSSTARYRPRATPGCTACRQYAIRKAQGLRLAVQPVDPRHTDGMKEWDRKAQKKMAGKAAVMARASARLGHGPVDG